VVPKLHSYLLKVHLFFAGIYGIKTDKEFVNTLEENIREWGEMVNDM
jgi:hypothetical protein